MHGDRKHEGPSIAAKIASAGAFGLATLVLGTLGGIWLYKRIKERLDDKKKSAKGEVPGKRCVKRRTSEKGGR